MGAVMSASMCARTGVRGWGAAGAGFARPKKRASRSQDDGAGSGEGGRSRAW